ncbi:hypothetical protein GCM10023322_35910 [Rugosimonospora acidiphila]|uniref:Glycosyl hydrolase family 26 n=1 Tax=Rugosimonospora acidiphila TaxID=556531 RepID=A0ABP9RWS9_9ACTN
MRLRKWIAATAVLGTALGGVVGVDWPAQATAATTTTIQDTARGTGVGQVQFSAGWSPCSGNCAKAPDSSFQWTSTVGASLTVRFTGHQITLYGMKEPWDYIGTVSLDGGSTVDVDYYASAVTATTVPVYSSPVLTEGTHTLVLTMTNRKNAASAGGQSITFDRAEVATGTPTHASGLPWSSGVAPQSQTTARADQFAAFRGAPVDNVVLFPPRDNWGTLSDPAWISAGLPTGFNAARDDLVMTIPLWPGSNSVTNTGTQAQWQNLANVIKAADPNAYIRLGWEMNLGSWYDNLNSANEAAWQSDFIQAVQWMKAVAPNLQIVWNPNKGADQTSGCTNCSRTVFQAVKNYVDVYGIDSYDSWPPDNSAANQSTHLNDLLGESLSYATSNGKRFAVPEWGIACDTSGCQWQGNAGGDNAQYINDYLGFFKAHAANLAFESYFDEPGSYIRSALDVTPIGPNAPAAYRADILADIQ